ERPRARHFRRGARHGRPLCAELVVRTRHAPARANATSAATTDRHGMSDLIESLQPLQHRDEREGPLRTAVVGLGYWGPNLLRVLHDLPEAEVAYACDFRVDSLERIKRRYPAVKATRSFD